MTDTPIDRHGARQSGGLVDTGSFTLVDGSGNPLRRPRAGERHHARRRDVAPPTRCSTPPTRPPAAATPAACSSARTSRRARSATSSTTTTAGCARWRTSSASAEARPGLDGRGPHRLRRPARPRALRADVFTNPDGASPVADTDGPPVAGSPSVGWTRSPSSPAASSAGARRASSTEHRAHSDGDPGRTARSCRVAAVVWSRSSACWRPVARASLTPADVPAGSRPATARSRAGSRSRASPSAGSSRRAPPILARHRGRHGPGRPGARPEPCVTAVGPAVPEEGEFPVPATSAVHFHDHLCPRDGSVPLRPARSRIVDELGHLHQPQVIAPGRRPPPGTGRPGSLRHAHRRRRCCPRGTARCAGRRGGQAAGLLGLRRRDRLEVIPTEVFGTFVRPSGADRWLPCKSPAMPGVPRDTVLRLYDEGVDAFAAAAGALGPGGWAAPPAANGRRATWPATSSPWRSGTTAGWTGPSVGDAAPPFGVSELAARNAAALEELRRARRPRGGRRGSWSIAGRYRARLPGATGTCPSGTPGARSRAGLHAGTAACEWHLHAWDLAHASGRGHRPSDPAALYSAAGACLAAAEGGVEGEGDGGAGPARGPPAPVGGAAQALRTRAGPGRLTLSASPPGAGRGSGNGRLASSRTRSRLARRSRSRSPGRGTPGSAPCSNRDGAPRRAASRSHGTPRARSGAAGRSSWPQRIGA